MLSTQPIVQPTAASQQLRDQVHQRFPDAVGELDEWLYPTNHAEAELWLTRFVEERFIKFGPDEDAMVLNQRFLYHSVLTPMLNSGLLTPKQVLDAALEAQQALLFKAA